MERKKWTPKAIITETDLKIREKKKWQLALRRYIIEQKPSPAYAPYFGLSIHQFREWIEVQFSEDLNWGNFGRSWQFEHLVPLIYFDFTKEDDLHLCWSFINIRVQQIEAMPNEITYNNLFAAKPHFQSLFANTGYVACKRMIDKITEIESSGIKYEARLASFIANNKIDLEITATLTLEEFNNLNLGISLNDILVEREIVKKFS